MQRMVAGLLLVLTAAVGVLTAVVISLSNQVSALSAARGARSPVSVAPRETDRATEARLQGLDEQMASTKRSIDGLGRRMSSLEESGRTRKAPAARKSPSSDPGEAARSGGEGGSLLAPHRDDSGAFSATPEEEDYFLYLQKQVQRKQRIDGMTRNLMRRLDMLSNQGKVRTLTDRERSQVEGELRRYVEGNDDLITKYLREPDAEVKALSPDERRDALEKGRSALQDQAQRGLAEILGEADAKSVCTTVLVNPWGVRLNRGFSGRGR